MTEDGLFSKPKALSKTRMFMVKILSLVLLFIIRIRYLANKLFNAVIKKRYGSEIVALIRRWERLGIKYEKAILDKDFQERSRDNNLTPHFLRFKLLRRNGRNLQVYKTAQRNLLNNEIKDKIRIIKFLERQYKSIFSQLKLILSFADIVHVFSVIRNGIDKRMELQKGLHDKKIKDLFYERTGFRNDNEKIIKNYSSVF